MKKIFLAVSVLGLFMGLTTTEPVSAQENNATTPFFCTYITPDSCFKPKTSHSEERKLGSEKPDYCKPKVGTKEMFYYSGGKDPRINSGLQILCDELKVSPCDVSNLQRALGKECSNPDKPDQDCYPIGEKIYEHEEDRKAENDKFVQCSTKFLKDGLYGICTREAVRRYIAWLKVNNTDCDVAPRLAIDGKDVAEVGVTWDGTVVRKPGSAWIWEEEETFIEQNLNDPEIDEVTISEKGCLDKKDDKKFPIKTSVDAKNGIIFPNPADPCTLIPGGKVPQKPILDVISVEREIKIESLGGKGEIGGGGKKTEDPGKLSCKNGLLPKYLVGADCDDQLKGDARDITYWIQRFAKQITTFIAALAVLLIAWNAFGLVTAGGDSDEIANKKKALIWVGAGLLLTVFAYVIVKTIISMTFLQ